MYTSIFNFTPDSAENLETQKKLKGYIFLINIRADKQ